MGIDERRESSQSDKTPTKQSSIFNFFNLFSPKSPEFEKPPRKRIKLDKMGPPIQDTPSRVENTNDVIISSPVGFFKVDDNSHIGSPKRPVLAEQSHRFVCQFCRISFSNMLSWKSHLNTHNNTTIRCPVCGEKFGKEKQLEKHKREKHS